MQKVAQAAKCNTQEGEDEGVPRAKIMVNLLPNS